MKRDFVAPPSDSLESSQLTPESLPFDGTLLSEPDPIADLLRSIAPPSRQVKQVAFIPDPDLAAFMDNYFKPRSAARGQFINAAIRALLAKSNVVIGPDGKVVQSQLPFPE